MEKNDLKYEPRECPRCEQLFICTGDTNCWCMNITIPPGVQDYIAAHFDDCLCKKCIRELIQEFNQNTHGIIPDSD